MKKIYEIPFAKTILLNSADVITTSVLTAGNSGFGDVYSWNDDPQKL